MQFLWYQYFELFSLLCAVLCRKGLNFFSIGIMIPILILDNVTEVIGVNYPFFGWSDNYFVYDMYQILSLPLTFWLFSRMLDGSRKQRIRLFIAGGAIEVFFIVNLLFIQGISEFNTYSALIMEIANIVLSCLLLTRLAVRKDDESGLLMDPYFWINGMILIFSLVTIIVLGSVKYISAHHIKIRHILLYRQILPAANAILYTGYTGAFLLCQKLRTN